MAYKFNPFTGNFDEVLDAVAGSKDLKIYFQEDFEVTKAADLTSGQNSGFVGGVLQGTLSDEIIAPLGKLSSLRYVQVAGSIEDYFFLGDTVLQPFMVGKNNTISAYMSYDGADDDIECFLLDGTTVINSFFIKASTDAKKYDFKFFNATSNTNIKVAFKVAVANNTAILLVDRVQLDTGDVLFQDIFASSDWASAGTVGIDAVTTAPAKGTIDIDDVSWKRLGDTAIIKYRFRQTAASASSGSGDYLIDIPSIIGVVDTNFIRVNTTASAIEETLVADNVAANGRLALGAAVGRVHAVMYNSSQFRMALIRDDVNGSDFWSSSNFALGAEVGFEVTIMVPIAGWESTFGSVLSNNIAGSNWEAFTPTFSAGFGTVTNASGFWKRNGDTLEGVATCTTGTVSGAFYASLTLPNGLNLDTAKITINNTTGAPGSVVGIYGGQSSNAGGAAVLAPSTATTQVYFSRLFASAAGNAPAVGNAIAGSSTVMSIKFSVPIAGWDVENQFTVISPLVNNVVKITDGVTAPATDAKFAQVYVDSADGDLKIKFSDGTVKTIVVDT